MIILSCPPVSFSMGENKTSEICVVDSTAQMHDSYFSGLVFTQGHPLCDGSLKLFVDFDKKTMSVVCLRLEK
jgi:hypothetical protein